MRLRKGITPLLAIVLLMAVTVASVSMFFEQYRNIVGNNNAVAQFEEQQKVQKADYSIVGVKKNSGGNISIAVKNTGDSTLDLEKRMTVKIGNNGQKPQPLILLEGTPDKCYRSLGRLKPGDTATCPTGVEWPEKNSMEGEKIQLLIRKHVMDTYLCDAGNEYC